MLRVALTGGIATGKSHVLMKLRERGIPVIDADEIVHDLMKPGTAVTQAVAQRFGPAALRSDGSVDRVALGRRVFASPADRLQLEAIVHPPVYAAIRTWFDAAEGVIGVASIPLLYETQREADFNAVVVTACKPEQQIERLMARGLSEEEARLRMDAQDSTEDKERRADYVIWTGGTKGETEAQVKELIGKLKLKVKSKK